MARKLFKKENVVDTAISVGLGGVANVAVDAALNEISALKDVSEDYINGGKFLVGVIGSTLVSNRYVKAAMDGVATVGIANMAKSLMTKSGNGSESGDDKDKTNGVPWGTVGARMIPGHKGFASKMKTSGAGKFIS